MEKQNSENIWRTRFIAIAEVTGVAVVSFVIAAVLIAIAGISQDAILPSGPNPDYISASINLLGILFLQYSPLFIFAYLIGRWHRGRSLREYGLSRNSKPLGALVLWGFLGFVIADLPAKIMKWMQTYLPLGPIPETQSILENADWFSWGFWLYMAIGSFLLVPIIEELFFRGYIQTRLEEDFGGPAAVLISSSIFTFGHVQYLYFGVFGIGNTIATFIAAIGFGFLYFKTRSLLPSIVMHAIANLPIIEPGVSIFIVLMIIVIGAFHRRIIQQVQFFWAKIRTMSHKVPAMVFMIYGAIFISLLSFGVSLILILGLVSLPIALYFEYKERKNRLDIQNSNE
ncbi:MAG: lysostaphin resistance A-like protein [Candidatus Thorarchaeota archaeon]